MSLASEWMLAVHRAIWFPVFYAMGLERDAIEAPIGGAYISRLETALIKPARKVSKARRHAAPLPRRAT